MTIVERVARAIEKAFGRESYGCNSDQIVAHALPAQMCWSVS